MTNIRFDIDAKVTINFIVEDFAPPFEEDEKVIVPMKVVSASLLPNEQIVNIIWRGQLEPVGEFDLGLESMIVELTNADVTKGLKIRWPADHKNVFNIFITSGEDNIRLLEEEPNIKLQVLIKDIRKNPFNIASMSSTWFATLVPDGVVDKNSIISEVKFLVD